MARGSQQKETGTVLPESQTGRSFSMNIKEPVLRNAQWDAEGPEGPMDNPQNGCEQVVWGGNGE